nr:MAG TPA: SAGA-associated factor 73-FINGER, DEUBIQUITINATION, TRANSCRIPTION FACTOR, SAGA [Caudoviricetes sp.]
MRTLPLRFRVCLHCLRCYNQIFFKSIDDLKKI